MSKPGGLRVVFDDLKRIRMIKPNQWRGIWIVFALLLVCSCGKIQNEYSDFRPYFVYNNNVRQCARLAEAMTPNSGMFASFNSNLSVEPHIMCSQIVMD